MIDPWMATWFEYRGVASLRDRSPVGRYSRFVLERVQCGHDDSEPRHFPPCVRCFVPPPPRSALGLRAPSPKPRCHIALTTFSHVPATRVASVVPGNETRRRKIREEGGKIPRRALSTSFQLEWNENRSLALLARLNVTVTVTVTVTGETGMTGFENFEYDPPGRDTNVSKR